MSERFVDDDLDFMVPLGTRSARGRVKYSDDEPRDDQGQWTDGGGGGGGGGGSGGGGGGNNNAALHEMYGRISQPDGGFTYQPLTGEEPKEGFAVSPYPGRSFAVDVADMREGDLLNYYQKNQDLFAKTDHYIGAWHDPASGKVFLDVSVVSKTAAAAEKLALAHDQIAYFDLSKFTSVTVNANAQSGGAAAKKP